MKTKVQKHLAGVPPVLEQGKEYILTCRTSFLSGRIILSFKDINTEIHQHQLDQYGQPGALNKVPAEEICVDLVVLCFNEKTQEAFRAQVLESVSSESESKVVVLAVDAGVITTCDPGDLHYINEEYLKIPFESFMCQLAGVDFFQSTFVMRKALETNPDLFSGDLYGIRVGTDKYGLPLLELKASDRKIDCNAFLLESIFAFSPGEFPKRGDKDRLGSLSHYEDNGEAYMHLGEESYVIEMEGALNSIEDEDVADLNVKEFSADDVYIAAFDGAALYRAKYLRTVDKQDGEEMVELYFMDYGNKSIVPKKDCFLAKACNPHLAKMPALCHKVYLKWIDHIDDMYAFDGWVHDRSFYIDVRSGSKNGCPIVQLWYKEKVVEGKDKVDGAKGKVVEAKDGTVEIWTNFNKFSITNLICKSAPGTIRGSARSSK